jgi:hypothetical protein
LLDPIAGRISRAGTFRFARSYQYDRCYSRLASARRSDFQGEYAAMKTMTTGLAAGMLAAMATSAMAQSAYDDATCRQWASQQASYAQAQANNQAVGSTLGGALLGAGIGAAIGGGRGAAIGAGAGAIAGSGAGAANAQGAGDQAYWGYYNQCMASRSQPAYAPQPYPPQGGYNGGQPSTQQLNQQQLNGGQQYYNPYQQR